MPPKLTDQDIHQIESDARCTDDWRVLELLRQWREQRTELGRCEARLQRTYSSACHD